ncbi:hypothetical protein NY609_01290, partial [Enterobacter hormaechei]
MEIERRADANGKPIHTHHNRLAAVGQCDEEVNDLGAHRTRRGKGHEILQIIAGGECARHPQKNMGADIRIRIAFHQRFGHGRIHGPCQGILLVRAV